MDEKETLQRILKLLDSADLELTKLGIQLFLDTDFYNKLTSSDYLWESRSYFDFTPVLDRYEHRRDKEQLKCFANTGIENLDLLDIYYWRAIIINCIRFIKLIKR